MKHGKSQKKTIKEKKGIRSMLFEYHKSVTQIHDDVSIVGDGINNKVLRKHKFNRKIGEKNSGKFSDAIMVEEEYMSSGIKINSETVAFLFHINGCSKNLLLYIISYLVDYDTCNYRANAHVFQLFKEYSFDLFGEDYKLDTIKQAHRELTEKNITCSVSRGLYKINPLLLSYANDAIKRQLCSEYTTLLLSKNKLPIDDFYPKFKK